MAKKISRFKFTNETIYTDQHSRSHHDNYIVLGLPP